MERSQDSIVVNCILMELYIEIHRYLHPLIRLVRRYADIPMSMDVVFCMKI